MIPAQCFTLPAAHAAAGGIVKCFGEKETRADYLTSCKDTSGSVMIADNGFAGIVIWCGMIKTMLKAASNAPKNVVRTA